MNISSGFYVSLCFPRWLLLFAFFIAATPLPGQNTEEPMHLAWSRYVGIPGRTASKGAARMVKVDEEFAVYVTGAIHNGIRGYDYFTIKYDAAGNEMWSRQLEDSATLADDWSTALVVDNAHNVYVSGTAKIVKFDPWGKVLWTDGIFNYSGLSGVSRSSLALDDSGLVHVLGDYKQTYHPTGLMQGIPIALQGYLGMMGSRFSRAADVNPAGMMAYAAVGYYGFREVGLFNRDGIEEWSRTDGIAGNLVRWAASGDVFYVLGRARDSLYGWINPCLATYSISGQHESIVIDTSWGDPTSFTDLWVEEPGRLYIAGSGGIVCLDTSGQKLWQAAGALASSVDPAGGIIVADSVEGDIELRKYDSNGNLVWTTRYDSPYHGFDQPYSVCIDGAGYVLVAGVSADQFATLKFSPIGVLVWERRVVNPVPDQFESSLNDIVINGQGDIVISGSMGHGANGAFLAKYSGSGDPLWARTLEGKDSVLSGISGIASGPDNSLTVAISQWGTPGQPHTARIERWTSDGQLKWSRSIVWPDSDYVGFLYGQIFLDGNGNTLMLCSAGSSDQWYANAPFLTKYSPDGNRLWTLQVDGRSSGAILTIDALGNAYVARSLNRGLARSTDIDKISPSGEVLWRRTVQYRVRSMVSSAAGMLYTAGAGVHASIQQNLPFGTTVFTSSGDLVWDRLHATPYIGNLADGAQSLAVDSAGNVYVAGTSSIDTWMDYLILKYGPDGALLWDRRFGSPEEHEQMRSMIIDEAGHVYVTGIMLGYGGYYRGMFPTVCYGTSGELEWQATVKNMMGDGSWGDGSWSASKLDSHGNLYMASDRQTPAGELIELTKYVPALTTTVAHHVETPGHYALHQNYPNPFNPSTTLRYSVPVRSIVTLIIYNTLGQKIAKLENNAAEAGVHEQAFDASSLPSGLYLYRLEATSVEDPKEVFIETKKMVLVK